MALVRSGGVGRWAFFGDSVRFKAGTLPPPSGGERTATEGRPPLSVSAFLPRPRFLRRVRVGTTADMERRRETVPATDR